MSASLVVPWDDALAAYNFGPGHPLDPLRVDLTMRLARALGVLDLPQVTVTRPQRATDDVLAVVHQREDVVGGRLRTGHRHLREVQHPERAGQAHREVDPEWVERVAGAEVVGNERVVPGDDQRRAHARQRYLRGKRRTGWTE